MLCYVISYYSSIVYDYIDINVADLRKTQNDMSCRDSKPGAFLLNPGFGFGKPQNPGFGSGSGLVRVWENGDCIQVKP